MSSCYKTLFISVGYDSNTTEGIISETALGLPGVGELKLVYCTEVRDDVTLLLPCLLTTRMHQEM